MKSEHRNAIRLRPRRCTLDLFPPPNRRFTTLLTIHYSASGVKDSQIEIGSVNLVFLSFYAIRAFACRVCLLWYRDYKRRSVAFEVLKPAQFQRERLQLPSVRGMKEQIDFNRLKNVLFKNFVLVSPTPIAESARRRFGEIHSPPSPYSHKYPNAAIKSKGLIRVHTP